MDAFCDIDQYQARYGEFDDPELLSAALEDASRIIASELDMHGIDYHDPDEDYAERLMQVNRDIAHRAVSFDTSEDKIPYGATQYSTGADGFTEYLGFQAAGSTGYGDMYMSKVEKRLLGIGRQRIGSLFPEPLRRCRHARR